MRFLITGGAGFIGSALIRYLIKHTDAQILNIDALTYAGNLDSLNEVTGNPRYQFAKFNICDHTSLKCLVATFQPDIIMHLAAESHVDRSINGPAPFIQTNIIGTFTLLEIARDYFFTLSSNKRASFRFHHVSTDEVFGDLGNNTDNEPFTENSTYAPSSPYSASKAAADHLVRAWHRTYDLPVVISNCSNNYGPYQFPEKLIPLTILNALQGKSLPIYGNGKQIRDWLYVVDHARALYLVATQGRVGETYNIGGHNELKNIDVVHHICEILETLAPNKPQGVNRYYDLIRFIQDRPGHDTRYAIDASKIERELGWRPEQNLQSGLTKTVTWYMANQNWGKA